MEVNLPPKKVQVHLEAAKSPPKKVQVRLEANSGGRLEIKFNLLRRFTRRTMFSIKWTVNFMKPRPHRNTPRMEGRVVSTTKANTTIRSMHYAGTVGV